MLPNYNMEKIVALIFAHNEEKRLPRTLINLRAFIQQGMINDVVVINDGSTDRTKEVCERLGVKVISHNINRGKRQSFITGVKEAERLGAKIIFSLDADIDFFPQKTLETMIGSVRGGKKLMAIADQYEGSAQKNQNSSLVEVKKDISNSSYGDKSVSEFMGEGRDVKSKVFGPRWFREIYNTGSKAQRVIHMSALLPLLKGNKKWMLYFKSKTIPPGNINANLSNEDIRRSRFWGLEKALDMLIPKKKTVYLKEPIFTDLPFANKGTKKSQQLSKDRLDYLKELRRKKAIRLNKLRLLRHKK